MELVIRPGYDWAGDINLRFIFVRLFSLSEFGKGCPPHRRESQQESLRVLKTVAEAAHKPYHTMIVKTQASRSGAPPHAAATRFPKRSPPLARRGKGP